MYCCFSVIRAFCTCRQGTLLCWWKIKEWLNEPKVQVQLRNSACCLCRTWPRAYNPGLDLDHGFISVVDIPGQLPSFCGTDHAVGLLSCWWDFWCSQNKNLCSELMIPQSTTLVIWGGLAGAPLSSLIFFFSTKLAGSGRTWNHFTFHLALAQLKQESLCLETVEVWK